MGKIIITIGREYGSGGRLIGKMVAEKLNIPFYDKELIAITAHDNNLNQNMIEGLDETSANRFFYALPTSSYVPSGIGSSFDLTMNDRLFLMQSKAIKQIADKGSAVIVGRCADYVLRDYPNVLNIFIYASEKEKIERAIKYYDVNSSIAKKSINKIENNRIKYYNYYTNRKRDDVSNYSLCINSKLGIDETTDIIVKAAKSMK